MSLSVTRLFARYARELLLVVPGVLTLGASLAMVGLPLLGWVLYGLGQVGLLLALPAAWATYRRSIDRLTAVGLLIAWVGVLLALPVAAMAVGYHLANPADGDALLAYELGIIGILAAALTWGGLAFAGLAGFNARSLHRTAALAFVLGGLLALTADLGLLGIPIWTLGVFIVSIGLVALAPPEPNRGGFPVSAE
jgi:hypothetical protein